MKIKEAYDLFHKKEIEVSISFKQQRYRIERFIGFVGEDVDSKEAINGENLVQFFDSIEKGINGFYYTLKNFYNFIRLFTKTCS